MKTNSLNVIVFSAIITFIFSFSNSYASPGIIDLVQIVDNHDSCNWPLRVGHLPPNYEGTSYESVSEGIDEWDSICDPFLILSPAQLETKIWTEVDGIKLDYDFRPANSTSTIAFYLSLAAKNETVTLDCDNWLKIRMYDSPWEFPNEDVYITINGQTYDAKTTSRIDLPHLNGTYVEGEVYMSGTITFSPIIIIPGEIDTLEPNNITATSATFRAEVTDDGNSVGDQPWTAGFMYKEHSSSSWTWTDDISGSGEGTFLQEVSSLYPNTQYDIISFITNSAGTEYGDLVRFWTDEEPVVITYPTVTTGNATNITHQSANLAGYLASDGDPSTNQAQTRIVYWKNGGQQITTSWANTTEGHSFSVTISGLEENTLYSFYAQAKNSTYTADGSTKNFTTNEAPVVTTNPTVTTLEAIVIGPYEVILQGRLDNDGDPDSSQAIDAGFAYWFNDEETFQTDLQKVVEGNTFTDSIIVEPNSLGEYFAFGINLAELVGQGQEKEFLTPDIADSNVPPIPFGDERNTAVFQYFVLDQDPNFSHGTWTYSEFADPNVTTGLNLEDEIASSQQEESSRIISLKTIETGDPNDPYIFVELSKHANPIINEPNNPNALNELTVTGGQPIDGNLPGEEPINMQFPGVYHPTINVWIKYDPNDPNAPDTLYESFNGKELTFQIIPDANSTTTNPRYSAKAAIQHNNRTIDLGYIISPDTDPNVFYVIDANLPTLITDQPIYASTSTFWNVADIDSNGDVNDADFEFFLQGTETTGPSIRDVADANGILGIPNNKIDPNDGKAIIKQSYLQNGGTVNGYYGLEDHFTHGLEYWWKNDPTNPWTTENGIARSGQIGNNGKSSLEFDIDMKNSGIFSFDLKTSTHPSDRARVYINNRLMWNWSGELDWRNVNYNLSQGINNIKIVYEKNRDGITAGDDAVYIRDVQVIPDEYIGAKAKIAQK